MACSFLNMMTLLRLWRAAYDAGEDKVVIILSSCLTANIFCFSQ